MKNVPENELFSAYLDGELSAEEQAQVEQLLATSPAARQLLAELRGLSGALQSLPEHRLAEDLSERILRQAERRMLGAAVEDSPEATCRAESVWRTAARRLLRPRTLFWPAVAIAVAVLLSLLPTSLFEQESARTVALKTEADKEAAETAVATEAELRRAESETPEVESPAALAESDSLMFREEAAADHRTDRGFLMKGAAGEPEAEQPAEPPTTHFGKAPPPAAAPVAAKAAPRERSKMNQTPDAPKEASSGGRHGKSAGPRIMPRKGPSVTGSMPAKPSVAAVPKAAKGRQGATRAAGKAGTLAGMAGKGAKGAPQAPQVARRVRNAPPTDVQQSARSARIMAEAAASEKAAADSLAAETPDTTAATQRPLAEWNDDLLAEVPGEGTSLVVLQCAVTPEVVEQGLVDRVLREQQIEPMVQQTAPAGGGSYGYGGALLGGQAAMPGGPSTSGVPETQSVEVNQQLPGKASVQQKVPALGMAGVELKGVGEAQQQAMSFPGSAPAAAGTLVIDAEATAAQITGLIAALKRRPKQFPQVIAVLPETERHADTFLQIQQVPPVSPAQAAQRVFIVQQVGPPAAQSQNVRKLSEHPAVGEGQADRTQAASEAIEEALQSAEAQPVPKQAVQQRSGAAEQRPSEKGRRDKDETLLRPPSQSARPPHWANAPRSSQGETQGQAARYRLRLLVQVVPGVEEQAGQAGMAAEQAPSPPAAAEPHDVEMKEAPAEGRAPAQSRSP